MSKLEWLMHLPYDSTGLQFYHKTIHVEDGWMVTTDGYWMRICPADPDEPEGDYKVGNNGKIKPVTSDEFWFFPPAWKKLLKLEWTHVSCGVHQGMCELIYQKGWHTPVDLLANLEEVEYCLQTASNFFRLEEKDRWTFLPTG